MTSLFKKRDECDMMILLNEERLFLCIYLKEVILSGCDFISSRCLLVHSYPFERFRMMNPNLLSGETVMRNATVYDPLIDQDIISYPRFSIFFGIGDII